MPNWCSNYLVVTGSADAIRQINAGFQKEHSFESLIGKDPTFDEKDWYYHEGVYAMDSDQWMTSELEWQMDNAKEEGLSAEDFVKQFPFLSEEDRLDIITIYNE